MNWPLVTGHKCSDFCHHSTILSCICGVSVASNFKILLSIRMKVVRHLSKLLSELKQYDPTVDGVALVGIEIALLLQFPQLRFTRMGV